jgi:N-acyl-D-amino-acid deacylase
MTFDLLIKNGMIVDGTGNPWFRGNIGIKNEKITKISRASAKAKRIIDAEGLIVAPGFIDMHAHDDLIFFLDTYNKPKLQQGITTIVSGNCGISAAPIDNKTSNLLKPYLFSSAKYVKLDWNHYSTYLDRIERLGHLGTNFIGLIGHGTLRIAVMGMKNRVPTKEELNKMKNLLAQSMKEGAFGISTGLIYPPGVYAKTEELIELSKVVARYGGIYATHMRDEGDHLSEAVQEVIKIGREAKVPVEISHYKICGKSNWGKLEDTLRIIEEARAQGIDITMDSYPYTAGSTYLSALLPPFTHEGGEKKLKERCKDPKMRIKIKRFIEERTDWQNLIKQAGWENIILSYSIDHPELIGNTISKISETYKKDPFNILFDIISKDGNNAQIIIFMMNEEDVKKAISHQYTMIGTDGIDEGVGIPHPRSYGTFPRVIRIYARNEKIISIEDAIRKMSSLPAQKLGIKDRGLLREGFWADIVIFDPNKIIDRATYQEPRNSPEGIEYVIVNGTISIRNGKLTKEKGGRILRKNFPI